MEWAECQITVMTMKTNVQGDAFFIKRLLSFLNDQFDIRIHRITPLRNHVFLIETAVNHKPYVLKGFSSPSKLRLQEMFTADLKKAGFSNTYSFQALAAQSPLSFENRYYGIMEYIAPSTNTFTFLERTNRVEGLTLLQKYHETTGMLVNRYATELAQHQPLEKWKKRTASFIKNIPVIEFFVQKEIIEEYMSWANWSLEHLEATPPSNPESTIILHGDVAHHNFLRSVDGMLYLIDFDLISIGEQSQDYLQYANRILPFFDWSFEGLSELEVIRPFLNDKKFLYGLAFPTDIFREWNRLIRERQYHNPVRVRPVMELTVGQFAERKSFFKEIRKLTM